MDAVLGTIQRLVGFDPATLLAIVKFVVKSALFAVPFLLLGLFFERGVDARKRLPWSRRLAKVGVAVLFALPLVGFGVLNLVGARWPEKLEPLTAAWPWLDELLILDGVNPPAVLIALVTAFVLLNAWEMLTGDLSA